MKVLAALALVLGLGVSLVGCGDGGTYSGGGSACTGACGFCSSSYDCCGTYSCYLYNDGLYRCAPAGPFNCKPG